VNVESEKLEIVSSYSQLL